MLIDIPYNRMYAIEYARKYALSRNPLFSDFTGRGGNCTSFASQCLLAGCSVMNFTPTFGWYYVNIEQRAPAWSGVEAFYDFLTSSGDFQDAEREGPYASVARARAQVELGDIVQLANAEGDFYHTLFITDFSGNEIFVSANSDDALDRPLSSYNYSSLRVLHIEGARLFVPLQTVFTDMYDAVALRSVMAFAENVRGEES